MRLELRQEQLQLQLQLQRLKGIKEIADSLAGIGQSTEVKVNELKTYLLHHVDINVICDLIETDALLVPVILHHLSTMMGMHEGTVTQYTDACLHTYMESFISSICSIEPAISTDKISTKHIITQALSFQGDGAAYLSYLNDVNKRSLGQGQYSDESVNPSMSQFIARLRELQIIDGFQNVILNAKLVFAYLLGYKVNDSLLLATVARQMKIREQESYLHYSGLFSRFLKKRPGFSNSKRPIKADILKHSLARLIGQVYMCSVGIIDHENLYEIHKTNQRKSGYLHVILDTTKENIAHIMNHFSLTQNETFYYRWRIEGGNANKDTQESIRKFLDSLGFDLESVEEILSQTDFDSFLDKYMAFIHINIGEENEDIRMETLLAGLKECIFTDELLLYIEKSADDWNRILAPVRKAKQQFNKYRPIYEPNIRDEE